MQRQSRTVQALARGARLAAGLAAAPALGLAGARLTTTVLMALGAAVLRAGALAAADFTAADLGAADFAAAVRDAAGLAAAERGAVALAGAAFLAAGFFPEIGRGACREKG